MMAAASRQSVQKLSALLAGSAVLDARRDREVVGISMDSRCIQRGAVFFARKGAAHDGSAFIADAVKAGACAVVRQGPPGVRVGDGGALEVTVPDLMACAGEAAHRFYARPSDAMRLVGITGTNGKTSVSHFVAHGLKAHPQSGSAPAGVIGTLGYGTLGRLDPGGLTTPEVIDVHRLLARIRDGGSAHAVMEVSSHALAQGRVEGVRFHTAVFTNLSRDHLDFHGDMAAYGETKARLFQVHSLKHAIINIDDDFGCRLLTGVPKDVAVTACTLSENDLMPGSRRPDRLLRGRVEAADRAGLEMAVACSGLRGEISVPLLGRFNGHNLLAALGALLAEGVEFEAALEALRQVPSVPGRMQRFGAGSGEPLVVVDYSHTPGALEAALKALREHLSGRLWVVFGCGGDRDEGKRPLMGAVAEQFADVLVLTDDNPRNEDGEAIIRGIVRGLASTHPGNGRLFVERDRSKAIALAVRRAHDADIVLVAGKGHETYQERQGVRRPFSDAAAVRAALEARRT